MANHWYTSDTHFGHANIITFCNRPFVDTLQMDEELITNWNLYVKPEDHIYHLGDVTMARGGKTEQANFIKLIKRLNGHKRLIMGNHDHFNVQTYIDAGFEKIMAMQRVSDVQFAHVPFHPANLGSCRIMVHGHIHEKPSPPPHEWYDKFGNVRFIPYVNISVEVTNYHPVDLEWIRDKANLQIEQAKNSVTNLSDKYRDEVG